jgi:drug/metabolite transporter (DMT)-like permease
MGQLDKQPDSIGANESQAAEARLRAMTQDIENLRQNLLGQLQQDIERLHQEKSLLIKDVEKLKTQRQQQILEQQQLVGQIAPALVNQLQEIINSRLNQLVDASSMSQSETMGEQGKQFLRRQETENTPASTAKNYNENVEQLITSLDSTLRETFRSLQRDLRSYQSSLSQQLGQMHSLEKQGEAILEALVSRLKKELQSEPSPLEKAAPPPIPPTKFPLTYRKTSHVERRNHNQNRNYNSTSATVSYPLEPSTPIAPPITEPERSTPKAVPRPQPQTQPASKRKLGLVLVLLSSLLLAFQNVVISIIFNKSLILGDFELGGFATTTVGNSLLILWLRMLIVVPFMAILASVIYPPMWQEIKQVARAKDWLLVMNVVASGFFLFLSQVLIYLALGFLSPGIAVTSFFIYPIFTVLLMWVLFGVRPTLTSNLVIFAVLVGFILITLRNNQLGELSSLGIGAAAGSGVAFALYVVLSQTCARKLKPIPLLWLNYVLILGFAGLSLAGPFPESWRFDVAPAMWPGLIVSCFVLAGTTLLSYLFNTLGLRQVDAARASILGATVPLLTALLAFVMIQSNMNLQQIVGMLIVTLGVVVLSFERWRRHAKAAKSPTR